MTPEGDNKERLKSNEIFMIWSARREKKHLSLWRDVFDISADMIKELQFTFSVFLN